LADIDRPSFLEAYINPKIDFLDIEFGACFAIPYGFWKFTCLNMLFLDVPGVKI